jgi:hypothetical protein
MMDAQETIYNWVPISLTIQSVVSPVVSMYTTDPYCED